MSRRAAARRRYTELHWGVESQREVEAVRPAGAPVHHTQLGQLAELHVVEVITFDDDVRLTEGEDGELYILSPRGVYLARRLAGREVLRVVYDTVKANQDALYEHEFETVEGDGRVVAGRPRLGADDTGHAVIERGSSRYTITERGIEG